MHNSAAKKHESFEHKVVVSTTTEVVSENIVEFVARSHLIAQQAEEACNLEGNINCDLDVFERQYGLSCFA